MLAALAPILSLFLAACGGRENRAATMHLVKTEGTVRVDDAKGASVQVAGNLGLYSGYDMSTREIMLSDYSPVEFVPNLHK